MIVITMMIMLTIMITMKYNDYDSEEDDINDSD